MIKNLDLELVSGSTISLGCKKFLHVILFYFPLYHILYFQIFSKKCPQCYPKARWTLAPRSLNPSNVPTTSGGEKKKKKKLSSKNFNKISG